MLAEDKRLYNGSIKIWNGLVNISKQMIAVLGLPLSLAGICHLFGGKKDAVFGFELPQIAKIK